MLRWPNWVWGVGLLAACDNGSPVDKDDTDGVDTDDSEVDDTDDTDGPNTDPTVSADDVVGLADTRITLIAEGADADGDALTYTWSLVSGPSTPALSPGLEVADEDGDEATFRATYAGTYVFQVSVSDGESSTDAVEVRALVHDIEGGVDFAVALKPDGTLWSWGDGTDGRTGQGVDAFSLLPGRVCGPAGADCSTEHLEGVVQVAAGRNFTLALASNGTVWAWGPNYGGQLGIGDGGGVGSNVPVQVCAVGETAPCGSVLDDVVQVAAGYDHGVALLGNGTLVAWGENFDGELGDNQEASQAFAPVQVCESGYVDESLCETAQNNVLEGVERIAAGGDGHTLALVDGGLFGWGTNKNGQCGVGVVAQDQVVPLPVCAPGVAGTCDDTLTGVVEMDAWSSHSLVIDASGTVWGWGSNEYGQIYTEEAGWEACQSPPCYAAPVQVCPPADVPCTAPLSGVHQVVAARRFSLALKDGEVWTWGDAGPGGLGREAVEGPNAPGRVCAVGEPATCTAFLSNVVGIAAGNSNVFALTAEGDLIAWGPGYGGALGTGSEDDALLPVVVEAY